MNNLEKKLTQKVDALLEKYYEKSEKEKKHVSSAEVLALLGGGLTAGTAAGTVVPGVGNAIGAVAGGLAGLGVAGALELKHQRDNKKINNAKKVEAYLDLGKDMVAAKNLAATAVHQLLESNRDLVKDVQEKDEEKVSSYLAYNLFSSMKKLKPSAKSAQEKVDEVIKGLESANSKKARSQKLQLKSGDSLELKELKKTLRV